MSTGTIQPLSFLHVEFDGLYTRHLGRHSQLGINIAHLFALYMIWFGIYATIGQALMLAGLPSWPVLTALALAYLFLVGLNAPARVILLTAVFLAVFVASVAAVPPLPAWSIAIFLAMIPLGYKIQSFSHKIWTAAVDMSEFNKKYPPGRTLNFILLIYEVPICLNYLVFRREDWRR